MAKMTPPRSARVPNIPKNGFLKNPRGGVPLGGEVGCAGCRWVGWNGQPSFTPRPHCSSSTPVTRLVCLRALLFVLCMFLR